MSLLHRWRPTNPIAPSAWWTTPNHLHTHTHTHKYWHTWSNLFSKRRKELVISSCGGVQKHEQAWNIVIQVIISGLLSLKVITRNDSPNAGMSAFYSSDRFTGCHAGRQTKTQTLINVLQQDGWKLRETVKYLQMGNEGTAVSSLLTQRKLLQRVDAIWETLLVKLKIRTSPEWISENWTELTWQKMDIFHTMLKSI